MPSLTTKRLYDSAKMNTSDTGMAAPYLSSSCTWSMRDMLRVEVGCHLPPADEKLNT